MLARMAKSGPEGRKAALLALGVLFMMAGASGLPGADDVPYAQKAPYLAVPLGMDETTVTSFAMLVWNMSRPDCATLLKSPVMRRPAPLNTRLDARVRSPVMVSPAFRTCVAALIAASTQAEPV